MIGLAERLEKMCGVRCDGIAAVEYEEPASDPLYNDGTTIAFSDGTKLQTQFWRLRKSGRPRISIFDHRQKYGLPEPIDAIRIADDEVRGKRVIEARMEPTTGDLHFHFEGALRLEVFNFSAYEIWEITFPDGKGEYSNYALAE